MKKIIIVSALLCSFLFVPVFASAQTAPTQDQLTQQLIQVMTQLIVQLEQAIATILAHYPTAPTNPTVPTNPTSPTNSASATLSFISGTSSYSYNATTPANSVASGAITFTLKANGGIVSPLTSSSIVTQICNSTSSCTTLPSSNVNVSVSPSGSILDGTTSTITVNTTYTGGSGYIYFKISDISWTVGGATTHQTSGLDAYKTPSVYASGVVSPPVGGGTPSITITSPNGGETYKIGDTMNITWNSANIPESANNYLTLTLRNKQDPYTGGTLGYPITSTGCMPILSQGSYSWAARSLGGYYDQYVVEANVCLPEPEGIKTVYDSSDNYFNIVYPGASAAASATLSFVSNSAIYSPGNGASGVVTFNIKANGGTLLPITSDSIAVQVCSSGMCTALPSSNVNVQVSPSQNVLNGTSTVTVNATYVGGTGFVYFKISEIDYTIGGATTQQTFGLDNYKTPVVNVP